MGADLAKNKRKFAEVVPRIGTVLMQVHNPMSELGEIEFYLAENFLFLRKFALLFFIKLNYVEQRKL